VDQFADPLATFGMVIIFVGVTALLASAVIGALPIALDAAQWESTTRHGVGTFIAFMFVLAPAALGGATVSLAARELFRGQQMFAGDLGRYYAINTFGGVLGALLAGFVLLPWAGLRGGIVVVAATNVVAGLLTCFRLGARSMTEPLALAGAASALAAIIYFLPPPITLKLHHQADSLLYYSESADASVAVVRNNQNQELSLLVHGDRQAVSGRLHEIHLRLLGHLPGLFSENQQDALVVGLGAGFTTGSILTHPFKRVTQVEISRAVPPASRYFEHLTGKPLNDPRLHLLFDDGRNVLQTTSDSFDAITTDPIDPNDAGATSLYAKEYYALVKTRLRPGGVATQWMGLQSSLADYRILVRTFQSVFPMTYLWVAGNTTVVIGFKDSPRVDRSKVEMRMTLPRVQESLAAINIHSLNDLLSSLVGYGDDLKQVIGSGPVNTDNFPLTEYSQSGIVTARPFEESILSPLIKNRQQAVASLFPAR